MQRGAAIVIDIGKTHARVSLWSRDGNCLEKRTRVNAALPADPYAPLDTAQTADWLIAALAEFSSHPVEAIVPVAHGAAVAGIRGGVLAFVPPDYEWAIPDADLAAYRGGRDSFALTGSPALPAGLNMGAQLHMLDALGALEGATLIPYAQYWAWLLTGVAVSEVTSLGCHTDLWVPGTGDFSPMAIRRGWAGRFAPMARAGDAVGTLLPGLARLTGLSPKVRIHAGLHDSNAALLAARGFAEIGGAEATVLSTGTWFVAMRSAAEQFDLAGLPEARDCLVNVDISGKAVPSARWMGGREIELLGERIDVSGTRGLEAALSDMVSVLPSQVPGCGPFPDARGRWLNWTEDKATQAAAIALYAALMADAALDLIDAKERLLVEGRFAASELFVRALARLRPGAGVWTAGGEADVSFGALRAIWPDLKAASALNRVEPLDAEIAAYRDEWRDDIEVFG